MKLAGRREHVSDPEETHTLISTAVYCASEPCSDPRQNRLVTEEGATYLVVSLRTSKKGSTDHRGKNDEVADEDSQFIGTRTDG